MVLSSYDRALLPKIWIERIPQYWERKVPNPNSYPKTTTAFDLKFEPEDKDAVKEMESNLNTEESIVKPEMIEEGSRLSGYLGSYNVSGVPGEDILLFPEKVPDGTLDIIAFHYTDPTNAVVNSDEDVVAESEPTDNPEDEETSKEWVRIEDAHIKDGFVYGSLNSFSPIAVFTIKKTGFYKTGVVINGFGFGNCYVCNGCPTTVKYVDNQVHVIDSLGNDNVFNGLTTIISGTIDDSDVDKINLSVLDYTGASKKLWIFHGSPVSANDKSVKIKESILNIKNCDTKLSINTIRPGDKVEHAVFNFDNVESAWIGCGESIVNKYDFNGPSDEALSLASPSRIKEVEWNVTNSKIGLFYPSGHCGRFYVEKASVNAKDSEFYEYFITGGSNGRTDYCESVLENCKINIFQTVNRGIVRESRNKLINCEITDCYVAGDASDPTVTGRIDKVYISFIGGKIHLFHRGTNEGKLLTIDDVKRIVELVKATVSTELTYASEEDKIVEVVQSVREV